MSDLTDPRCTSRSEDGRRCHGDVGHPGTHWAGVSRVWSEAETLVRPVPTAVIRRGVTLRVHGLLGDPIDIVVADVRELDENSILITPVEAEIVEDGDE